MELPVDIRRNIVSYNLKNPRILSYAQEQHLPLVQLKQKVIEKVSATTYVNPSSPIFVDLRNDKTKKDVSLYMMEALLESQTLARALEFFQRSQVQDKMYVISDVGFLLAPPDTDLYNVYVVKKGIRHGYVVIYRIHPGQNLFIEEEGGQLEKDYVGSVRINLPS